MKRIVLLSILGAFTFGATAQTSSDTSSVTISAMQEISLPVNIYKTNSEERREIRGQYELENGKVLTVSNVGRKIYAEIEGQPQAELVAASPNIFVATNRKMKLKFEQYENGSIVDVLATYVVRDQSVAGAAAVEHLVTVASLR
ncbi:MAG: hypothetical protein V4447_01055 [Pseudomonadota bacterium]